MSVRHVSSYYSASMTPDSYPELQDDIECDVCVIGGGFSGVNTAIELAQRGKKVVLVESRCVGWGATGRNGGQLLQGIGNDLQQFEEIIGSDGINRLNLLGVEAVDIVKKRISDHAIDCDLNWGHIDLANKSSQIPMLQGRLDHILSTGYEQPVFMVSKQDISSFIGSDFYVGGLVDMGSGHLHPLKLIAGEARVARGLGVQIFERSSVISIDTLADDICIIRTHDGSVKSTQVVVACNAYIEGLEPTLSGKILPAGSYIIATERLSDELANNLLPHNYAASDNQVGLNYFRLSADNRMLFGGACHYSGRDPKDISAYMAPKMVNVFPQLCNTSINFAWGGMIGIGANRFPQVGRLKDRPQLYYAQAYSGHGLNATHLAAKMLADAMTLESGDFDLFDSIPHMTFPGGKMFRSQLLALGMLWLRLKELGR